MNARLLAMEGSSLIPSEVDLEDLNYLVSSCEMFLAEPSSISSLAFFLFVCLYIAVTNIVTWKKQSWIIRAKTFLEN